MPQIRLECAIQGLEGNWVDISDVWTRRELVEYRKSLFDPQADGLQIVAPKLVGVHLHTADGALLSSADQLLECFEDLDMRLYAWLAQGIGATISQLLTLGETYKRLLFDGVEVAAKTTKTTPTPTPK